MNPDTQSSLSEQVKKPRPLNLLLKLVIPAVISIGLCWILFRDDSLDQMVEIVRTKCDFRWIGLMLVAEFMSYVFRALRWRLQLEGVDIKPRFITVLYSIFGTYAVNLVFPRLGEIWRTGFIAHKQRAPFGTVLGTMLADRFADIITAILFVIVTAIIGAGALHDFIQRYPQGYEKMVHVIGSPTTWIIIALLVVGIIVFFRFKTHNTIVTKVRAFTSEMWHGFASILQVPHMGQWLLWTVGLWGCYVSQMYFVFEAFPFTHEILAANGFTPVIVCFTLGSVAMGIPSNGGIGPYQIALIFGLMVYCPATLDTVARQAYELDAKAFANLVLSASTVLNILVGLWAFIAIAITNKRSSHNEQK